MRNDCDLIYTRYPHNKPFTFAHLSLYYNQRKGVDMLNVFVLLGAAAFFVCGLIAGIEIGTKETLRQLEEEIEF